MTATTDDNGWHGFMTEPASYTEGSRVAACFGVSVKPSLGKKLLESERLHVQVSALLTSRYELPSWVAPEECTAEDRAVALSSAEQLQGLVKMAGAIYWSSAIASAVLAKEVQALHGAVGADICAAAIKHRDLSAPSMVLAPLETLAERITQDGWRCLAAWCDAMPNGVGKRVRLKLPASPLLDTQATSPYVERGPNIVRRACQASEAAHG